MRFSRRTTVVAALTLCAAGFGSADALAGTTGGSPVGSSPSKTTTTVNIDALPPLAKSGKAVNALRKKLSHDINGYGGTNSALVVDATTDKTLWEYDARTQRLPASVEKLYTTSAALSKFGPSERFQTRIYGKGTLEPNGTFKGTLYLVGGGDPTFGSQPFDHAAYDAGASAHSLVAHLQQAGVKRLEGKVVADATLFDSHAGGPDTNYHANLETEGALSALAFNAGFTSPYEDHLQKQPPIFAAQQVVAAMREQGITVAKNVSITKGKTPKGAKELASVQSPSLTTLIELTNSPSDNFFAEMLNKNLGAHFGGKGSTAAGAAVVEKVIAAKFGLHPVTDDGSGLSRYDHTTALSVVGLLRHQEENEPFLNSLAIAGVRGTMEDEMTGTRAVNNCRGKTGTLHDVANLVGYCTAANGHKIVFAFLMNGLTDADGGHYLEDLAGEALAEYKG